MEETDFINWIHLHQLIPILVLTKADKLSKNKQSKQIKEITSRLNVPESELISFSAKSGLGRDRLWTAIEQVSA